VTHPESRKHRLGVVVALGAGLGYALFAPVGLLVVPLTALVLTTRLRRRGSVVAGSILAGISLWWLTQVGEPPDQVVRAAALIGTSAFVATSLLTGWTLTHRAVAAVGTAAVGTAALLGALGLTWSEVRWFVGSRLQYTAQLVLPRLFGVAGGNGGNEAMAAQFESWFDTVIPVMADLFPAMLAIQMIVGLSLATVLSRRLTPAGGVGIGRFRDFRFSEHLGWIAVLALAVLLVTRAATVKLLAGNVLVVAGFLYGLRGAAVAWFGITLAGGPGFITIVLLAFAVAFMLPVVLTGAILLGVVDAGLDLRRRWASPREQV
jgi:hypothetical protein